MRYDRAEQNSIFHEVKRQVSERRANFALVLFWVMAGIILVLTVLGLVLPDRDFSESENRNLASFPQMRIAAFKDGSFFTDLGSYIADQFAGRDLWISLKATADTALGERESGGVYIGSDGYLMQAPAVPDQEALADTRDAISSFQSRYPDLNAAMILVPDAATILSDRLPKGAPVEDQLAQIRAFEAELPQTIQMVDAAGALAQDDQNQRYYRTDHHWTSRGAYDVFTAASEALGIETPADQYQIYRVSESFLGTMSAKTGHTDHADTVEVYHPVTDVIYEVTYPSGDKTSSMYVPSALDKKDHYQVFFGGNYPTVRIRTTADNGRRLLIFKDSYANSFVQFLTPYFEQIIMVDPRYYYENIDTLMTTSGITDLLYLYSADTLFTDKTLRDVLSPEG